MSGRWRAVGGRLAAGPSLRPMTTQTTPRARIRHRTALAVGLLAISLLTVSLFVSAAPSPRFETTAGDTWYEGEGEAHDGPPRRQQRRARDRGVLPARELPPRHHRDAPVRVDASTAYACRSSTPAPNGVRRSATREMRGLPVTDPVLLAGSARAARPGSRSATGRPASTSPSSPPRADGSATRPSSSRRSGSAEHRVAVVLPTRTWQAYNFRDADGDGIGDTWYATRGRPGHRRLHRPFLNRGVPPHFRGLRPALPPLAEPHRQAGRLSLPGRARRRPTLRRCAAPTTCSSSPGTTST